jgi:hypothetical protein
MLINGTCLVVSVLLLDVIKILPIKVGMSIEEACLPCLPTSYYLFLVLALSNFNNREVRKILVMIDTKKYEISSKPKVLDIKNFHNLPPNFVKGLNKSGLAFNPFCMNKS